MSFNIEKFKQELKNQLYEKTSNIGFLKKELGIEDESLIKNNLPYLREGLFLYVKTKITGKSLYFKKIFELLKEGQIKVVKVVKSDFVITDNPVPLNNFNEKKFAEILVNEFTLMENFLESDSLVGMISLLESKNLFQKSFLNGLMEDEKILLNVILEKNLDNKEFIDSLIKLPSLKSKKYTKFGDYYAMEDNNILSDLTLKYNINYLELVEKESLRYENSKIKKIFSCDENKRAFFITGAVLLLNNKNINKLHIIQNYRKEDIIFNKIHRDKESSSYFDYDSGLIEEPPFEGKSIKAKSLIKLSDKFKENGVYLSSLINELDKYLIDVNFKDKNKEVFHFSLLELYFASIFIQATMSKGKDLNRNHSIQVPQNYVKILDKYLASINKKEDLNNEIIGMNRWNVFNNIYLSSGTKDIIDLIKKYDLNRRDLALSKFNEPISLSLEKGINNINVVNNIDKIEMKYIKETADKIVIEYTGLEKSFLIDYNIRNCVLKNISANIKMNNESKTYNKYIEIDKESLDKYSTKDILLYLLKTGVDFAKDINFHSYMLEKEIRENISIIDKQKEKTNINVKKAKI